MLIFKYICFVIALFCTCLYVSSIIFDIASTISWKESLHFGQENNEDDTLVRNAGFRLIVSIIMALTWGVVAIL